MESVLARVDSRIKRIRLDQVDGQAQIMLGMGLMESIPLSQVGQGVSRLVAMLSTLVGEWPLVCIVDEIENGIHHTALRELWKGLAEVCEQLDIQLFATTHSHECIEAAHEAMADRTDYNFSVIQLSRAEAGIKGRVLGRNLIEAAIGGGIDLR
jgi:AAA15 family ATPase/GTPase